MWLFEAQFKIKWNALASATVLSFQLSEHFTNTQVMGGEKKKSGIWIVWKQSIKEKGAWFQDKNKLMKKKNKLQLWAP